MPAFSGATVGRGVQLGIKLSGDADYVDVGTLVSIDGPKVTVGEAESTLSSSTQKQYLPTIPELEMSCTIRFNANDAAVAKVRGMYTVPIPIGSWQATYPDGSVDTFDGYIKEFSISGLSNEEVVDADVSIRITSEISTVLPTG